MINLDKNTYGDSQAEETLTKIVNETGDKNLQRSIGRMFEYIDVLVKKILSLDKGTRVYLYTILRKEYNNKVDNGKNFSEYPQTKSYIKNIIAKKLRTLCRK